MVKIFNGYFRYKEMIKEKETGEFYMHCVKSFNDYLKVPKRCDLSVKHYGVNSIWLRVEGDMMILSVDIHYSINFKVLKECIENFFGVIIEKKIFYGTIPESLSVPDIYDQYIED